MKCSGVGMRSYDRFAALLFGDARMSKSFQKGDYVEWDTSQGPTRGVVEKKQTSVTHIKSHKVAASKDNPQYIVQSTKSKKRAAHKPEELRKAK